MIAISLHLPPLLRFQHPCQIVLQCDKHKCIHIDTQFKTAKVQQARGGPLALIGHYATHTIAILLLISWKLNVTHKTHATISITIFIPWEAF